MSDLGTRQKHVLVVGASSGIGFELCSRLSGVQKIMALARRIDRLEPLEADGVAIASCDVTDLESIPPIVEQAVRHHGKLDTIVYCAGRQSIKPLRAMRSTEIAELINVNLTAAAAFARLFASSKVSTSEATFCAVSSIAGRRPEPGIVAYSAAKAGLDGLIKGMARELGPRRAIGIAPGWLDTEMTQAFPMIYNDQFKQRLADASPCGTVSVSEVVDLIEYLISPAARHLTGQIITIDGGASL